MAEEKLLSEGKCAYCDEMLKKSGISKHLDSHLKKMAAEKPHLDRAFHIRVEADVFFLNLLVDADMSLDDLDDYLRAIWLECCGHMSSFREKGKGYDDDWDDDEGIIGEDKSQPLKNVLRVGQKLQYEYDFGSTTALDIKVLSEYRMAVKDGIQLLSRNEPLKVLCQVCGTKPAASICSAHGWGEAHLFCKSCAKKHTQECGDFEDYQLKVVNSPRAGVCAYDGGQIDKKRDGIWKPK
jgi:hypothetical protein